MKNKNIIIDGDKFQKEYKKQYKKDLIVDFILGITVLIISISGLFFGSDFLLKLGIFLFPAILIIYATKLLFIGISMFSKYKSQSLSYFIQSVLIYLIAVYIISNPIDTLSIILILIGIFILVNAITKMIYFPGYLPIPSFVLGILLILFSDLIIKLIYSLVLILLLIYGIYLISKAYTKYITK